MPYWDSRCVEMAKNYPEVNVDKYQYVKSRASMCRPETMSPTSTALSIAFVQARPRPFLVLSIESMLTLNS